MLYFHYCIKDVCNCEILWCGNSCKYKRYGIETVANKIIDYLDKHIEELTLEEFCELAENMEIVSRVPQSCTNLNASSQLFHLF